MRFKQSITQFVIDVTLIPFLIRTKNGGKYCDICEILMGIIDTQISMNKSSKEINSTIYTICQLFSRDVMIVVSDII